MIGGSAGADMGGVAVLFPWRPYQVYLQDEERLERREREQLAEGNDCDASSASRRKAAKLGPCEDKREERDSAARVSDMLCCAVQ